MNTKKLILITGGTGLLGKGMEETIPDDCQIISIHQRPYIIKTSKVRHLVLDIRDKRAVDDLFFKYQFDAVIHAAGIASVDYVENHYAESLESNIVGTLNITSACRRSGTYLIYISTNAVFSGKKSPYAEHDFPGPVNKYGQLKLECERLVSETLIECCIVRPILMYGWNHSICRPSIASWIYGKLIRGESLSLVNDVYENPLYNIQCGRALWVILERRPYGIFHFAGKNIVNRYEFGEQLALTFGLDTSLLHSVNSSFFSDMAPRPSNTSFITNRMECELGVIPLSVSEGLLDMKNSILELSQCPHDSL
jgi:dTDP-4-dehydrorhamnose reductase